MTTTEFEPRRTCPVCGSDQLVPIATLANAPVFCNVLLPSRDEAMRSPVGDVELAACGDCSHITNVAFDESKLDYSVEYENSLHFSPTFQEFATALADRLISAYGITNSQVVELGCGKGDFLAMLAARGANEAIGFDPSYAGGVDQHDGPGSVRVIADTYQAAGRDLRPSLIATRHVLEHLEDPALLISGLHQWSAGDPLVYLEVPNADYMISESAVWDVIYEHPSYFTARSLARLCTDNGLTPIEIESPFGGQYLSVHARLGTEAGVEAQQPADTPEFGRTLHQMLERWSAKLSDLASHGRTAAVWGAGSKGVSFSSVVPGAADVVDIAVDLNPRKKGRFMPASGIEVTTPDDPRLADASLVLVMNPLYVDEIRSDIKARGLDIPVELVK